MIVEYSQLTSLRTLYSNKKIVLFKGSFDLFHYAHLQLLKRLSKLGDIFIVEIKTDIDIKNKKGKNRPIIGERERAEIVDNIKCVDYVIIANEQKNTKLVDEIIKSFPEEKNKLLREGYLIENLHPDIVCTTNEVPVPKGITELCEKLNIKVEVCQQMGGIHTSDIIRKIKEN